MPNILKKLGLFEGRQFCTTHHFDPEASKGSLNFTSTGAVGQFYKRKKRENNKRNKRVTSSAEQIAF